MQHGSELLLNRNVLLVSSLGASSKERLVLPCLQPAPWPDKVVLYSKRSLTLAAKLHQQNQGFFVVVVLIYLKLFGITWEEATIKTHIQLWCL